MKKKKNGCLGCLGVLFLIGAIGLFLPKSKETAVDTTPSSSSVATSSSSTPDSSSETTTTSSSIESPTTGILPRKTPLMRPSRASRPIMTIW